MSRSIYARGALALTAVAVATPALVASTVAAPQAATAPAAETVTAEAFTAPAAGRAGLVQQVSQVSAGLAATTATVIVTATPALHFVSPNSKFTVSGTVSAPGSSISGYVQLEQKYGSDWLPLGKPVKFKAGSKYTISGISEDLQDETTYRVVVPNGTSIAGASSEFTLELGRGKHTAYKLLKTRWKACADASTKRTIKYAVNVDYRPVNAYAADAAGKTAAIKDIDDAVQAVADATGLTFENVTTDTVQPLPKARSKTLPLQEYKDGAEIVIAFADNSDPVKASTLLPAKLGKVLGVGGSVDTNGDGLSEQGYIALDARQKLGAGLAATRTGTWGSVMMHEMAHVMGVTHPSDTKQIMAPTANWALTSWGAGDLNALRLVGLREKDTSATRMGTAAADTCA